MPNWMSDEDLALINGDSWQCDHCNKVHPIESPFCGCAESFEAARESAEQFNRDYLGDGTLKTRQFVVTIVAPNTDMGFREAWDSMATFGVEDGEGSDDILNYAWTVKEVK